MPRERVAFIAAPYGFGPSSKAVAISSHLPRSVERIFFGDGPPLDMARRANEFSDCLSLDFEMHETRAAELFSEFSALVFINSTRFLRTSARVCSAVIFVDTLAWLRKSWPPCLESLSAHFAQRFFDHPFPIELESMGNFHPVGAIVPKTLSTGRGRAISDRCLGRTPIVHCGGLFSPAMCRGAGGQFLQHVLEMLECFQIPARVILPQHLRRQFARNPRIHLSLIECSPTTVSEHLMGSPFALTTSGIEFSYESMILGVPTLFLPPFNSTQCLQLEYHRRAFNGCVQFSLSEEQHEIDVTSLDRATEFVQMKGMLGSWKAQFDAIGQFLFASENRPNGLEVLGLAQAEAMYKVGIDGAQTIASCVARELNVQGKVECASLNM